MKKDSCLFCNKNSDENEIICENELFYARYDNFPVVKGHCEIVPKEHTESLFDLESDELKKMFELLKKTKEKLQDKYSPDAYNIGVNDGKEAGRTIDHLHVHLIPRYEGDVKNRAGGIRNMFPSEDEYAEES
ncbi:MAG: HIT family protein [Candidatus Magasanikbacteria bacterium]